MRIEVLNFKAKRHGKHSYVVPANMQMYKVLETLGKLYNVQSEIRVHCCAAYILLVSNWLGCCYRPSCPFGERQQLGDWKLESTISARLLRLLIFNFVLYVPRDVAKRFRSSMRKYIIFKKIVFTRSKELGRKMTFYFHLIVKFLQVVINVQFVTYNTDTNAQLH